MVKKIEEKAIHIDPPNMSQATFGLIGTAPLLQNAFPQKAINAIKSKQQLGSQAGKGKKRDPRNYEEDYLGSQHVSTDGWIGHPCSSLRAALISACKLCGFAMTRAKLSVFVLPDGFDKKDAMPLVKIYGTPEPHEMMGRIANGVFDIRVRTIFREWKMTPTIQWDNDQFSIGDISNLLMRVGIQVGIGEGRPDSKMSSGLGYGTFSIEGRE